MDSGIIAAGISVKELRCECRVNPLGIDVVRSRLSWIVESNQRGQKQTAYQILVADNKEDLEQDQGQLWNSNKVESGQFNQVVYKGQPLLSRMRCYWKVRVWDKDGEVSPWSEPAMWTVGLLELGDWQAKWIGYDAEQLSSNNKDESDPNALCLPSPLYLRRAFLVGMPVRGAVVYASALGLYELHVNDKRVSEDYFTPGWTDYPTRVYYQTYDVTDLIKKGGNAIGATTIWERWDGWTEEKGFQTPGMNSFNHYSFGSVGRWLFGTVAGIDTDGPGYKRIRIEPRPGGGITSAKASYKSIYGKIASDWSSDGRTFTLNITIPANTTATVYMPAGDAESVTEGGRPAMEAEAVQFLRMEDSKAVFAVGSGQYRFVSKPAH